MELKQKTYIETKKDGRTPHFRWKLRGTNRPTLLHKCLVNHIAQYYMIHGKDDSYAPSNKEAEYLAQTFARWLGDMYINVDEAHWKAIGQQINWLFTKQDLSKVNPKQQHCVQMHYVGRNLLEELLK